MQTDIMLHFSFSMTIKKSSLKRYWFIIFWSPELLYIQVDVKYHQAESLLGKDWIESFMFYRFIVTLFINLTSWAVCYTSGHPAY